MELNAIYKSNGKPYAGKTKDLSQVECYGCQEKGHLKRDCPKTKKDF